MMASKQSLEGDCLGAASEETAMTFRENKLWFFSPGCFVFSMEVIYMKRFIVLALVSLMASTVSAQGLYFDVGIGLGSASTEIDGYDVAAGFNAAGVPVCNASPKIGILCTENWKPKSQILRRKLEFTLPFISL
jgi:hypothetical protein